jgi:phosphate-selective porin
MQSTCCSRIAKRVAGVMVVLGAFSSACAQESMDERLKRAEIQFEDNRKTADLLQKQNETLLKLLNSPSAPVSAPASGPLAVDEVRNIIKNYLQEEETNGQKAAEVAATGKPDGRHRIGSDLRLGASWKDGLFVTTPKSDFAMHVGGWVQYDNIWWGSPRSLQVARGASSGPAQGIGSGASQGGIGSYEDGAFFRRIRLQTDGKFWENYEFNLTLALENMQYASVGMDEFWVGAANIPVIGTVRVGHLKNSQGLEGNWVSSSKTMTLIAQSPYSEAINLNQNDVTGLRLGNSWFDECATWSAVLFRPDQGASSGAYFGNDQWGWQARLTSLPIYEANGRHLLHLGLSGGWRSGSSNNAVSGTLRTFQLRARPELRDDVPASSASGVQLVPNANTNRLIDTGTIVASNDFMLGGEFLYILGPFSIQAEGGYNFIQDATGFLSSTNAFTKLPSAQAYAFKGGYVQLAYTLTGENRSYDKRLGRLDSFYFGRQGLNNNVWFVRDEDGRLNFNTGAWELAVRYTHVDLNDGSGFSRVQGGVLGGIEAGVNWYLNDNMKFMMDYAYDRRSDLPVGVNGGASRGFGMRMQFLY